LSSARYQAVLTGATGGIGRAMALRLASLCESLLLVGRDAAALAVLARDVEAAGGHPRAVAADLTMVSGRDAVLRAASGAGGGVDLLVNNAGTGEFAWLADQDDASLERIVRVNVLAPMQLTRRLLPLMLKQPTARIVNVGSIFGYLGYPGHAAYCASKFALRGFSEALRRELADGPVQVTYFAPRESVAGALVALLEKPAAERPLGMPERLFAWLNQVTPRLVDRALLRQLPVIRRYARGHANPQPLTQGVKS